LQEADAADLAQEVLRAVARSLPAAIYDPARGAFRGWLYPVTSNKLNTFLARRPRAITGAKEVLEAVESPDYTEARWQTEYETRLVAWAGERVRGEFAEKTWQAFWMTAVEGKSGDEAGATLGMTAVGVGASVEIRINGRLLAKAADPDPAAAVAFMGPPGCWYCPVGKEREPGSFDLDYLKVWRLPLDFRLEGK